MRRNDSRARRHAGWWAFVVHRVSGLALSIFLPLHLLALGQSMRGEVALGEFLRWADQPIFKFAVWGLTVLLAIHLLGGIRLLWIEFLPWKGLRKGLILATGMLSMLFGLALAVTIMID